jgi:hypothetical protein
MLLFLTLALCTRTAALYLSKFLNRTALKLNADTLGVSASPQNSACDGTYNFNVGSLPEKSLPSPSITKVMAV